MADGTYFVPTIFKIFSPGMEVLMFLPGGVDVLANACADLWRTRWPEAARAP
jgi:hypothetical protein